ncbi:hypothetical protein N0V88_000216 [Collariella sp. IMI 366227]|nr:hypothetical protein N0V88_000216 [Collariella sp. IMI 366227]
MSSSSRPTRRGIASVVRKPTHQYHPSSSPASSSAGTPGTSYVIESSEEEEEEVEVEDDEEDEEDDEDEEDRRSKVDEDEEEEEDEEMEFENEDAEGEEDGDEMDVDAEGEDEDDMDVDVTPAQRAPAIKVTRPPKGVVSPSRKKSSPSKPTKGVVVAKPVARFEEDDDDDEELSELESDMEDINDAVEVAGGEEDAEGEDDDDVDAEGEEEIEVVGEDAEGEELDSDDALSHTPDLSKLTARQRARLGDASHEYLKLSDEVQAKKVFTAEELSMRRAEMARRRRNLSEKRNEEVKMETINKLLKKQAPKTTKKAAALLAAGDETPDQRAEVPRADPMFVRPANSQYGSENKNITSSDHLGPIDHGVDGEDVGNYSDSDSIFGSESQLKEIASALKDSFYDGDIETMENTYNHGNAATNTAKPAPLSVSTTPKSANPQTPAKNTGYGYNDLSGSGRCSGPVTTTSQLSFPKIAQPVFTPVNHNSNQVAGTIAHEESPNGSTSNTATIVNQPIASNDITLDARLTQINGKKTPSPKQSSFAPEHVFFISDPCDILFSPKRNHNVQGYTTPTNVASANVSDVNSAIKAATSASGFTNLPAGAVADGKAVTDPKLPDSSNMTVTPQPATIPPVPASIEKDEETVITSPSKPLTSSNPSSTSPHHPRPPPPTTTAPPPTPSPPNPHPLADELRATFWAAYAKELQLLATYTSTYKTYHTFITTHNPTETTPPQVIDHFTSLKYAAISAQIDFTQHYRAFTRWKNTVYPEAVKLLIKNASNESCAMQAAEKASTQREEFVRGELKGVEKGERRERLRKYDEWVEMMRQSQMREMWRGRVEVLVMIEGIIEGEMAEQRKVKEVEEKRVRKERQAEEEKIRVEAKAEEARKKAEEEAEELRAVEERLLAAFAQSSEQEQAHPAVETQQVLKQNIYHNAATVSPSALTTNPTTTLPKTANAEAVTADPTVANNSDSEHIEQQFPDSFNFQDGADLRPLEPLDFETIFAEHDAMLNASGQENAFNFDTATPAGGFDFITPLQPDATMEPGMTNSVQPEDAMMAEFTTLAQPDTGMAQQFNMAQQSSMNMPEDDLAQQYTTPLQSNAELTQKFTMLNEPTGTQTELVPFPDFMTIDTQTQDAMVQESLSADVQAQLPSIADVMSTPKGKKKAQPRKRKSTAKGKVKAKENTVPQVDQSAMLAQAQQMIAPTFGLDQVMAADPFVSTTPQHYAPNNVPGIFDCSVPIMAMAPEMSNTMQQQQQQMEQFPALPQSSSGFVTMDLPTEQQAAAETMIPQTEQMPQVFNMFMQQPGSTSSPAPVMPSPATAHIAATPSSDNKRKVPASRSTGTPTKRRQSVNSQGAIVSIPQDIPASPPSQPPPSKPPAAANPLDPALHFNISPPSGPISPFGTAIKAGICAVVKAILRESKKRGTVLDQVLTDGPQTAFAAPDTAMHIKQVTRGHLAEVYGLEPESEHEAFNNGAYKVLQAVVGEIEREGKVFGKELLLGPVTGVDLVGVKKAMAKMYKEVSTEYVSPYRGDGPSGQAQQTPTRASGGASQNGLAHAAATFQLQAQGPSPGSSAMTQTATQQPTSRHGTPSPMQQQAHASPIITTQHQNPRLRKSCARTNLKATTPIPDPNSAPTTPNNNGHCKPRLSYDFTDRCFYMHLSLDPNANPTANTTAISQDGKRHKIGAGTAAAQASLTQFLEARRKVDK